MPSPPTDCTRLRRSLRLRSFEFRGARADAPCLAGARVPRVDFNSASGSTQLSCSICPYRSSADRCSPVKRGAANPFLPLIRQRRSALSRSFRRTAIGAAIVAGVGAPMRSMRRSAGREALGAEFQAGAAALDRAARNIRPHEAVLLAGVGPPLSHSSCRPMPPRYRHDRTAWRDAADATPRSLGRHSR